MRSGEMEVVGPTDCKRDWSGSEPRRGSVQVSPLVWLGPAIIHFLTLFSVFALRYEPNTAGC